MSDAALPFVSFIDACTDALSIPRQVIDHDRCMFKVADHWVELRYSREDDRVTFAAVASIAPPDAQLREDLISSFNVYHLFHGGFSLVEGAEGILYLCRPHQLAMLEARHIREDLIAFANAVASAGTWYIRTDEERPRGSAPSRLASTNEDGPVLRA